MREGRHRLRMEAVEGANQLTTEQFEAMEAPAFVAAKVEVEGAPIGVGVARILPQDVEMLFPFGSAISHANRIGQSPVKGIPRSNSKQLDRSVIDEVRQLLDLIIEQQVAGVHDELALDCRDRRQVTKDDAGHAS